MILVASAAYEAIAENLDSHGVSNYRRSVVPPPIMSRLGEAKLWKSLARIFLRRIFSLFSLLQEGFVPSPSLPEATGDSSQGTPRLSSWSSFGGVRGLFGSTRRGALGKSSRERESER